MVAAHRRGGSGCGHRTVAAARAAARRLLQHRGEGSSCSPGSPQPWLKEAAKRWARARLLAGGAPRTMASYVRRVGAFSGWLADRAPAVSSPAGISRAVLEDWMLSVRHERRGPATRNQRVMAVRLFLEEQWQDGLAGLPRTAVIHVGEVPHNRSRRLPRGIEAPVFDQFIDPANLALLPCEQHRTRDPAAGVHRAAGLQRRDAAPRRAPDRLGQPPVPALRQRQAAARGGDPDRPRCWSSSCAAKRRA